MKNTRRVPVAAHFRSLKPKASDLEFERTTFALQCFVVGRECERELEQKLADLSRADIDRILETN